MGISFDNRISISPEVLISEVGAESVLLNLKSERYFGLDDVGTRMWHALTTSETIQSAYEALIEEYDVEPESLKRDLAKLIEKLAEHGLVEIRDE
jgi:hypothetical protein